MNMMEIMAQMRENKKIEFKDQLKIVILLSVPAILEQLVGTAMSYIDTAMVGSLGYKATAAIGVVASTTWLFGGICTAAVLGFSVQVAQYLGAGKNKLARQVARERPVHALDLAVLPGAEGPRVLVPYPAGLEQRVELARPIGRSVVGHHAFHGDPEALVERERPLHEGAGRPLPLVGQLLGVGDPAVVVDGHVQARRPGAPPRPAAAPEGPMAAALGYARHLLDVDVDQLPGALALVAHARDGAAGAQLARDAVDVVQTRQAPAGHDPGAGAGGHARLGGQRERRQQQPRPRLGDAGLGLGRREPRQPARAAAPVGHGLAASGAREPLVGGLAAHAGHRGGVRDAHAAAHALAEQRPSPRGQPCVRMLGHGRPLLTVCLDNSQHAGGLPICHYSGVNNLLALNS